MAARLGDRAVHLSRQVAVFLPLTLATGLCYFDAVPLTVRAIALAEMCG
jgi:hypothetical protein